MFAILMASCAPSAMPAPTAPLVSPVAPMAAAGADGCFGPAEVPTGLERATDATIPEKAVGKTGEGDCVARRPTEPRPPSR